MGIIGVHLIIHQHSIEHEEDLVGEGFGGLRNTNQPPQKSEAIVKTF